MRHGTDVGSFIKDVKVQSPQREAMTITVSMGPTILKLNNDATFKKDTKSGVTRAILHNSSGFFTGVSNQLLVQVQDVDTIESMALHHILKLALHL